MAPRRSHRVQEAASHDENDEDATITNGSRSPGPGGMSPAPPSSRYAAKSERDHVKIMLATDNHIGYLERDPVRGQDSINTFREILQLAQKHEVDFILLGGDLFHENKPSRTTLHQVMGLLREYTLGDRPISIELLSDPNDGRAEGYSFPAVNYEDANLNVAIPCFSIHGNHDDPQGVGAEGALSALDLLSVSGLVNYFGKVELPTSDEQASRGASRAPAAGGLSDVGIRIRPVLLRKGNTKIALYGMGNIKDERMHFELRKNRVRMYRPREDPDDWFNILTIHQNRAAHDPKAVVPETMFDDSIHLVVWGHEHEQRIVPETVSGKRYHVSQPGSSVATSLSPGEAAEKQVAIIHVEERDFLVEPITLQTVRPFVMDDIDLDEAAEEAKVKIDEKQAMVRILKKKVNELIARAEQDWLDKHEGTPPNERPAKMLPLIRLRVAYTRYETGNIIRFGQQFVDKVANPRDLLHFYKKKAATASKKNLNLKENYVDPTDEMLPPESLERVHMSDLVKTFLTSQTLQILNPAGLERAVMNFVDKDDRDAISHFVDKEMKSTNSGLVAINPDELKLQAELDRIREEKMRLDQERAEKENDTNPSRGSTKKGATGSGPSRRATQVDSDDSMLDGMNEDDDDDDSFERQPARAKAAPVQRKNSATPTQRTRQSGRSPKLTQSTLTFRGNSEDDADDQDQEDENNSDAAVDQRKTAATSSRAAALNALSSKKKAPAKKTDGRGATAEPSRRKSPAARSTGPAPGGRAAARKASSRFVESQAADGGGDDDDDDFEDGNEYNSIVVEDSDDDDFETSRPKGRASKGKR